MPEPLKLAKAELVELEPNLKDVKSGGNKVAVQFNPDSLKVSFANQVAKPDAKGKQKGTAGWLFVGTGNTKLSLQLWFDITRFADGAEKVDDVRKITRQIAYFMKSGEAAGGGKQDEEKKYVPPPVCFRWGVFSFNGVMETMEETLDYWSHDGHPLRATVTISMSQQTIDAFDEAAQRNAPEAQVARLVGDGKAAGTSPLTSAPAGVSFQQIADAASKGDWQSIAAANGIENPRHLAPGQLLNLNVTAPKLF